VQSLSLRGEATLNEKKLRVEKKNKKKKKKKNTKKKKKKLKKVLKNSL